VKLRVKKAVQPSLDLAKRRTLKISGALVGLSFVPGGAASALSRGEIVTWRGIALGAAAEMQIVHRDRGAAQAILDRAVEELRRLEHIFNIYDASSDLSCLNKTGVLRSPPGELVEVLSTSLSLARLSAGAFDPTVQVLWDHYAQEKPFKTPIQKALGKVDYHQVRVSPQGIHLGQDAMALTLNGIAQGYITDRLVSTLRDEGLNDVLVDCGEIYGAGRHPSGRAWQVALTGNGVERLSCRDQAIATSSGVTLVEGATGLTGPGAHIFDPSSGKPVNQFQSLTVVAPSAILADGLSTAFSVMEEEGIRAVLAELKGLGVQVFGQSRNGGSFLLASP
jgi:FAD:protein FMN transferase